MNCIANAFNHISSGYQTKMTKFPIPEEEYVNIKHKYMSRYIYDSITTLEEWSGKSFLSVMYDSYIDGEDVSDFNEAIKLNSDMFFIIIDSEDNVFGNYHSDSIDKPKYCSYAENAYLN